MGCGYKKKSAAGWKVTVGSEREFSSPNFLTEYRTLPPGNPLPLDTMSVSSNRWVPFF